jgi:hypothetical protein
VHNLPIIVISSIHAENLHALQNSYPGVKSLHKPFSLHALLESIETSQKEAAMTPPFVLSQPGKDMQDYCHSAHYPDA